MHRKIEDPFTYYNWQLLRRNPMYRTEYDQYATLLQVDEAKAQAMLLNLVHDWGMSSYTDWRIEDPEMLNLFFEPITNFGLRNYEELSGNTNPIENFIGLKPSDRKRPRFLLMALDLERLRSKDYENFLKVVKEIHAKHELKIKDEVERVRSNPKHLDVMLATYDEQQKSPSATTYEIAQALIDLYGDKPANPSQHTRKVEENLVRAKKFIQLAPNILFDFSSGSESK